MTDSSKEIYIVEDDLQFSKVLAEAFQEKGYSVKTFQDPLHCIQQHKLNPPDLIIVDCMLPQIPGVEMMQKIHKEDANTSCILMSGIFNDKNFIKDALEKTKAHAFFTKPFEVDKLIQKVEESIASNKVESSVEGVESLYLSHKISLEELKTLLQQNQHLHAFHLIKVIRDLMKTRWHGSLNLQEDQDEHIITFHDGHICGVQIKDPNSFFGRLLVDRNYITSEELDTILATPSKKRIGEKLVDANLLSPHTIDLINAEQMCLRLGLLFKNTSYEYKLNKSNTTKTNSSVNLKLFDEYLIEWVLTKFDAAWLETFYMKFLDNPIVIPKAQIPIFAQLKENPLMRNIEEFFQNIKASGNINDFLLESEEENSMVFKALHILTTSDYINFDKSTTTSAQTTKLGRVKNILEKALNQNHFEVLGLSKRAKNVEIKNSYHNLAKIFHPDTVPLSATEEYKNAINQLFELITTAYETLSDENKKQIYLKTLETGQAEIRLQVESLFQEAKELLHKRKYKESLPLFEKMNNMMKPNAEIQLYHIWAQIQLSVSESDSQKLATLGAEINKIPPEDRHSAIYYFIKGLFQKLIGEKKVAINNFKHALSIDPSFIEAKRELNVLQLGGGSANDEPIDILNADLKDVVGHFLKKVKK